MMPFFFFWLFHISWKEEDDFPGRYARCAGVLTGMLNTWAILTLSSYNIIPLVGGWVEAGQDHAQLLQSSDTSRWSVSDLCSLPLSSLPRFQMGGSVAEQYFQCLGGLCCHFSAFPEAQGKIPFQKQNCIILTLILSVLPQVSVNSSFH